MANDMLKKYVAEKRTGANLVGIQVDTQNAYLLDRGTGPMMLNALEEIAKKADIARIENEKQNLLLEAEETDLKFKKERLSDPLVYSDDEKYYGAMSDFNNLRKKKESLIAKSSFLTLEQKKQMIGRLKNNDELTLIGMMEKRNGVVIQKQVDDIIANTERKIAIAGQLSVNDIGGKEQAVQDITDMTETLKNLVGWNDSQASLYVSKNIMAMEKSIFGNEINKIINSGFSLSEKKNKINNLLSVVNNEEILNKMSEQYASQIKFNVTDEEFKESVNYFKAKIKDVYAEVKQKSSQELQRIEYNQLVQEKRVETARKKEVSIENKIKKYATDRNIDGLIEIITGKVYTTDEKLNDNLTLKTIYNRDMNNFGNKADSSVGKFLSTTEVTDIKNIIKEKGDATSNYDIATQAIYPLINKMAKGDSQKEVALLKDLGSRGIKGFSSDVLINGKDDPEYYNITRNISEGLGFDFEYEDKLGGWFKKGKESKQGKIYEELKLKLGGDNRAKKALDNFIKGYIVTSPDPTISEYKKDFKTRNKESIINVYNEILDNPDFVNYVKDNKDKIRKIAVVPINYKKANIDLRNLKVKELEFSNPDLNNNDIMIEDE